MANLNIVDLSGDYPYLTHGNLGQVQGLVVHHTASSDNATPQAIAAGWKKTGTSAQFVMGRDGTIYQMVPEGGMAYQTKASWNPKIPWASNSTTQGIELIAKDDSDVTPAQVAALQQFAIQQSQRYGYDPATHVVGHGEINGEGAPPGTKGIYLRQPTEGMTAVNALRQSLKANPALAAIDAATGGQPANSALAFAPNAAGAIGQSVPPMPIPRPTPGGLQSLPPPPLDNRPIPAGPQGYWDSSNTVQPGMMGRGLPATQPSVQPSLDQPGMLGRSTPALAPTPLPAFASNVGAALAPQVPQAQAPVPMQRPAGLSAVSANPSPQGQEMARLPSGQMIATGTHPGSNPGSTVTITRGPDGNAIIQHNDPGLMNVAKMGPGTVAGGYIGNAIKTAAPQAVEAVKDTASNAITNVQGAANNIKNSVTSTAGNAFNGLMGMFGGGSSAPAVPAPQGLKALPPPTTQYTTQQMQVSNPAYLAYIEAQKADPIGAGLGSFSDLQGALAQTNAPPKYITKTVRTPVKGGLSAIPPPSPVTIASGKTVPVGTTGTAQGGKFTYTVRADGSIVDQNGRVTSPATTGNKKQSGSGIAGSTIGFKDGSWQYA